MTKNEVELLIWIGGVKPVGVYFKADLCDDPFDPRVINVFIERGILRESVFGPRGEEVYELTEKGWELYRKEKALEVLAK